MIARQARNNPAQEAVYKTRHLNVWVTGNQALFAMDHWTACEVDELQLEQFAGRTCILGLDIANKIDLTALVLLFPEEDSEGKEVYSVFCCAWLPEARVESQPVYAQWISSGWLTQTPGETTDFSMIEEAILECCASFDGSARSRTDFHSVRRGHARAAAGCRGRLARRAGRSAPRPRHCA